MHNTIPGAFRSPNDDKNKLYTKMTIKKRKRPVVAAAAAKMTTTDPSSEKSERGLGE